MDATSDKVMAALKTMDYCWFGHGSEAKKIIRDEIVRLRERVSLADNVIRTADAHDSFDCPHYPEDRCRCGNTQMELAKKWNLAKMAYDKIAAAPVKGE